MTCVTSHPSGPISHCPTLRISIDCGLIMRSVSLCLPNSNFCATTFPTPQLPASLLCCCPSLLHSRWCQRLRLPCAVNILPGTFPGLSSMIVTNGHLNQISLPSISPLPVAQCRLCLPACHD